MTEMRFRIGNFDIAGTIDYLSDPNSPGGSPKSETFNALVDIIPDVVRLSLGIYEGVRHAKGKR